MKLLTRLDRLKFIELQPGNRIRLLVSRSFSWLPEGPIQRYFQDQVQTEFFGSRFNRPDEFMLVVNGLLSKASAEQMIDRMKRAAREFSERHSDDARLPLESRSAMSMLVALRHWELAAFAELRRRPQPTPAGKAGATSRRGSA